MTERERYYYDKGKYEGLIEGMSQGHKMIAEYAMKETSPKMIIQCNGESHMRKFLEEMKS